MHALLEALDRPDVQSALGPEALRDIAFLAIESAKYRHAHFAKCRDATIREDRRTKIGLRWDVAVRAHAVADALDWHEAIVACELRRLDADTNLNRGGRS
jgi:hypothetical protein